MGSLTTPSGARCCTSRRWSLSQTAGLVRGGGEGLELQLSPVTNLPQLGLMPIPRQRLLPAGLLNKADALIEPTGARVVAKHPDDDVLKSRMKLLEDLVAHQPPGAATPMVRVHVAGNQLGGSQRIDIGVAVIARPARGAERREANHALKLIQTKQRRAALWRLAQRFEPAGAAFVEIDLVEHAVRQDAAIADLPRRDVDVDDAIDVGRRRKPEHHGVASCARRNFSNRYISP